MKEKMDLQLFAFDENEYCDFEANSAKAVAGADILLCVYSADGEKLLAISGQQGLTINRSAESIEVTSKDTKGGWKSKIPGMKEWSVDVDGIYVSSDESHKTLNQAFEDKSLVCLKVYNGKTEKGMFGGLACITEYSLEAPYDDSMTYSMSFEGNGPLKDISESETATDKPEGIDGGGVTTPLESVSISGTAQVGQTLTANALPSGATATYKWKQADTESGQYSDIVSATGKTYQLQTAQQGKYIKVEATGTGDYSGVKLSTATTAVVAQG